MTDTEEVAKRMSKSTDMKNSTFSRSPVSIIIPFHGQYHLVARAVRSIIMATKSNPYEIVLVDDASTDKGTFSKRMTDAPQVRVMRSEKRLGFGGACRAGFESSKQPYIVFMHSDVVIEQPNWLIEMGRSLLKLKDKNVRIIAPKTNNPGLDIPALKGNKDEIGEDVIIEDGFLPLYCVLCHRELFSNIGGFMKEYELFYEDEELGHRMKTHGFKQAVCGKSWVRHDGGKTISSAFGGNRRKIIAASERSRELCIADIRSLNSK